MEDELDPDDFGLDEDTELDEAASLLLSYLPKRVSDELDRVLADGRTPLGPGDPRLHHYIPQFFLRRFANEDEEVVTVDVDRRQRTAHVSRTAAVKDFYRTHDEDIGDTVVVEKLLAVFDGAASAAIERLALGVIFPPSRADRAVLGVWFALLTLRGPGHRRWTEAMSDQLLKMQTLMAAHNEPETADPAEIERYLNDVELVEHQNSHIALMMNTALRIAPAIGFRFFAVAKFEFDGLVLSDRGITMWSQHRSPLHGIGLATADELRIPLDRRTLLTLHNVVEVGDVVIKTRNHQLQHYSNQLACESSHNEMYCHPDDVGRLNELDFPSSERPLVRMDGGPFAVRTDGINEPPRRRFPRRYTPPASGPGS